MNMKSSTRFVVLAVVAFGLAYAGYRYYAYIESVEKSAQPIAKKALVEVIDSWKGEIARTMTTSGVVVAKKSIALIADNSGRVVYVGFKDGQTVNKDDILFEIDSTKAAAILREKEAHVHHAKAEHDVISDLFKKGAKTKAEMDKTKASLDIATASRDAARKDVDDHVIKAPFAGILTISKLTKGMFVQAGAELATLVDSSKLFVDFNVSESDFAKLRVGMDIDIYIADSILPQSASIVAINAQSDSAHTFLVRARLQDTDTMHPGQFAKIEIKTDYADEVTLVPIVSVIYEDGQSFVYVVKNGYAVKQYVDLGVSDNENIQISHGLSIGDAVVVSGQHRLQDGAEVKIVEHETEE